jgi:hypothetical protein
MGSICSSEYLGSWKSILNWGLSVYRPVHRRNQFNTWHGVGGFFYFSEEMFSSTLATFQVKTSSGRAMAPRRLISLYLHSPTSRHSSELILSHLIFCFRPLRIPPTYRLSTLHIVTNSFTAYFFFCPHQSSCRDCLADQI